MTSSDPEQERTGPEVEDQDAGPASEPAGAAVSDGSAEDAADDQDAGPASEPSSE